MPAVSKAQERLMRVVAHNKDFAEKVGIPQSVGREFEDESNDDMGIITNAGVLVDEQISPNISVTRDGFLLCENAVIARLGSQEYQPNEVGIKGGADGKVHLLRSKDEVFKPKSLASFEGAPITIGHPREMVNSKNWSSYAKGEAHNVRTDGSLVRADLLIKDASTIKQVQERGLKQLSCGYYSILNTLDEGIAEQTSILGNHIALVTNPRAGAICSISDSINKEKIKETQMAKNKTSIKKSLMKFIGVVDAEAEKEAVKLAEELGDDADMGEEDITDADMEHEKEEDTIETSMETLVKELSARVEALEARNKAEEAKLADEVEGKVESEEDTIEDEAEDEEKANGEYAVGDSYGTIISQVEILSPGAKLMTSLGDSKNTPINISQIKKQALGQFSMTDNDLFVSLVDSKSVDDLSGEFLDMVFNAAVAMKRQRNNSIVKQPVMIADEPKKEKYNPYAGHMERFYNSKK